MRQAARAFYAKLTASIDRRDVLFAAGGVLVWFGGERLYPGAGYAASGAILVAVATLVR